MKRAIFYFTIVAVLSSYAGQAEANLIINGSFENGLNNWTVGSTDGNPANIGPSGTEGFTDGSTAAIFNGGQLVGNTILSQSFATVLNLTRFLEFDFGAFSNLNNNVQELRVQVTGNSPLLDVTISDISSTPTTFATFTFPFVTDSSLTTISFTDLATLTTSFNSDGVLDRVSVTPVPEPSTMLLLGSGLAGE